MKERKKREGERYYYFEVCCQCLITVDADGDDGCCEEDEEEMFPCNLCEVRNLLLLFKLTLTFRGGGEREEEGEETDSVLIW